MCFRAHHDDAAQIAVDMQRLGVCCVPGQPQIIQPHWVIIPGCTQMMRVDVTKHNKRFGIVKLNAKAYVGEDIVCEAELTLAMGS